MTADTRTDVRDNTRLRTLWASVLLGPISALLGLELAYALTERACVTGDLTPVHISLLGCLTLSLVAAALGRREWRRWSATPGTAGGREARSRFLATLGLTQSAYSALVIIAQWSAILFLHPCR
jgi:hypothetical protein